MQNVYAEVGPLVLDSLVVSLLDSVQKLKLKFRRAELCFEVSTPPASPNKLSYYEQPKMTAHCL